MKKASGIIHICSYYTGQSLYSNLIAKISQAGISQQVYIPIRSKEENGRYERQNLPNTSYHYNHVLRPYHRVLYHLKIKKTLKGLVSKVDLTNAKITHAHSLFSDGGIALKLKEKYGIPYIVAVRNTDLNGFFKFMPHLRPFALNILRQAKFIVFINPSYQKQLFDRHIPDVDKKALSEKCVCIPNGIDDFWHENYGFPKTYTGDYLNLLYVGTFIRRKNVPLTIATALRLNERRRVTLTLVGGGGNGSNSSPHKKTLRAIEKARKDGLSIQLVGKVENSKDLCKYYREADLFVMPSYNETFGLVYIEALTQGTPIIYTANNGVDGFFKEGEVGQAVHNFSEDEMVDKIERIIEDYDSISKRCVHSTNAYKWDKIAKQYLQLYN